MCSENVGSYKDQIQKSIDFILQYGMFDGGCHKQWVLDQVLRILLEDSYQEKIDEYNLDENYMNWDQGIAP